MANDLRAYRVFIASPSGLAQERQSFRMSLAQYNEDEALERGVSFWPVGWEDTLGGVGRPQSLINEDIKRCDYFVLVLCDRWGSPPSAGSGAFTSGTEEEYHVARTCLADASMPMRQIVVLFKGVSERQLSDPGDQLKKVLAFRRQIEAEKQLLFHTFDVTDEFGRIIRRHLAHWVRDHESNKQPTAAPAPVPVVAPEPSESATRVYSSIDELLVDAENLAREGRAVEAEALFARAVVNSRSIQARLAYAKFLRRSDRLNHAKANYQSALELAVEQNDDRAAAESLANIGVIERRQRNLKEAEEYLRQAETKMGGSGSGWEELRPFILGNLAHVYSDRGEFEKAEQLQRQAIAATDPVSQGEELANNYGTLGVILRRGKRWKEAEAAHREGIRLSEALGPKGDRTLAYNCGSLGLVLQHAGNFEEAARYQEMALKVNQALGRDEGQALNLGHLAASLVELKRLDEAEAKNEAALAINGRRGNPEGVAYNYSTRGRIAQLRNDVDQASKYFQAAADLFRQVKNFSGVAHNSRNLARVLVATGRTAEAVTVLAQAEEVAGYAGDAVLRDEIRAERSGMASPVQTLP
jgi:tetratricopeptide (TPR) repeat protein